MPPRIQTANAAGTGLGAWYESIPPITRFYATAITAVALAGRFQLLPMKWLILYWPRIINHFEVWRLLTNFFIIGPLSLSWLFSMIWLIKYGAVLESQTFQFAPADFLFALIFGAVGVLGCSCALMPVLGGVFPFNGNSIIFMLLYLWSRYFPEQRVSVWGLFEVMSFHLPFVYLGLEFLMQGSIPYSSLLGVVAGHLYFYLKEIYPAMSGRNLLQTPLFLKNLLADFGVGRRVNTHAASGQDRFRAFTGRGMRLGGN